MTGKGKHASGQSYGFYRDLAIMIAGILLVGAAVFFLLLIFADGPTVTTSPPPLAGSSTTAPTTAPRETTTTQAVTTTSSPTTTSSTTIPVRSPGEVRVVVLNSVGIAGAAGRLTEKLEAAGYLTLPADNYQPELAPSRIWYRDGLSREANELLAFILNARVEPLPPEEQDLFPGADVVIILGTGYQE